MAFLAHNARFHCFLELVRRRAGSTPRSRRWRRSPSASASPSIAGTRSACRSSAATLDGRFDDAERLAREALRIARLRQSEYADVRLPSTRSWSRSAGRRAAWTSTGREVADHGERFPWIPRWRDALAAAELGDRGGGARGAGAPRRHGFAEHPAGRVLAAASVLARRGVRPRRRRAAAERSTSCCCRSRTATPSSYTQQPFGPGGPAPGDARGAARALGGRRAALRGRARALRAARRPRHPRRASCSSTRGGRCVRAGERDDARARGAARRRRDRLSGELGLERVRGALGGRAGAARRRRFVREGEFWTIAYDGQHARGCATSRACATSPTLLAAPGARGPRARARGAGDGAPPSGAAAGDGLHAVGRTASIRCSTRRRKAEYRRRLEELRAELDEARGFGDDERAARLEQEIDALVERARAGRGAGRPRPRDARRPRSGRGST